MRHAVENKHTVSIGMFGIDTAMVLFFLALEYGRSVRIGTPDGILMAITMAMVLVLPYFLPAGLSAPTFFAWLGVRTVVAVVGLVFGAVFSYSLGLILPESLRFVPMTFLIIASMVSCYVQFYGLLKLRLAK